LLALFVCLAHVSQLPLSCLVTHLQPTETMPGTLIFYRSNTSAYSGGNQIVKRW
jgi:hypothetical protein